MLLKMHFIRGPHINFEIDGQFVNFFYSPLAQAGLHGQSMAGAFVIGSQNGGTVAGIAEPEAQCQTFAVYTPTRSFHPISLLHSASQPLWGFCGGPPQSPPVALRLTGQVVPAVRLRPDQRSHAPQNAGPNFQQYGGHLPTPSPLPGTSSPVRPIKPHGADGHSVLPPQRGRD